MSSVQFQDNSFSSYPVSIQKISNFYELKNYNERLSNISNIFNQAIQNNELKQNNSGSMFDKLANYFLKSPEEPAARLGASVVDVSEHRRTIGIELDGLSDELQKVKKAKEDAFNIKEKKPQAHEEQSALKKFLNPQAVPQMISLSDLVKKEAFIINALHQKTEEFLLGEMKYLNDQGIALNAMKDALSSEAPAVKEIESTLLILKNSVDSLKKSIDTVHKQVGQSAERVKSMESQVSKKTPSKEMDPLERLSLLMQVFKKYYTDKAGTIVEAQKIFDELFEYALKNPSKQMRKMMMDVILSYDILEQESAIGVFQHHMKQSLIVNDLLQGFSDKELEDIEPPEDKKMMMQLLSDLPKAIALFNGIGKGASIPIFSLLSPICAAADAPIGVLITELVHMCLGGWEQFSFVSGVQKARELLPSEDKAKLVAALQMLQKDYANMQELEDQRHKMRALRAAIDIEQTGRPKGILHAIKKPFKRLALTFKHASWSERIVRTAVQIILPVGAVATVAILATATIIATAPIAPAATAAIVIGSLALGISTIAFMTQQGYGIHKLLSSLNRKLGHFYPETVRKVDEELRNKKLNKLAQRFIDNHDEELKRIINESQENLKIKVDAGKCDRELKKTNKNREEYLREQNKNIEDRIRAAAFLIYKDKYTTGDTSVSWDECAEILNVDAAIFNSEEVKVLAEDKQISKEEKFNQISQNFTETEKKILEKADKKLREQQ